MGNRTAADHHIGGPQRTRHPDAVIGALADAQHGVVSRAQLLAAGISRRQIERRLERGSLRLVHSGVYAVGHAVLSWEGRWMAAVLYGGDGAVLSHWSAATLWRMRSGTGPRTHVTTPRKRRSSQQITFHNRRLAPDEITEEQGIPTTTPARTLLDLAPLLPSPVLARMIEAAPARGAHVPELLDRYPRRPGAAKLVAALGPAPLTRSDLEAKTLDAIERAGLPRPQVNTVIEGYEVDFVWQEHHLVAELDTYVTHGSRTAFEQDRERDRKLAIVGWTVVRITDEGGVEDLTRLLGASAARAQRRRA